MSKKKLSEMTESEIDGLIASLDPADQEILKKKLGTGSSDTLALKTLQEEVAKLSEHVFKKKSKGGNANDDNDAFKWPWQD